MSEPINVDQKLPPERANTFPYRIELPPNPVGVTMIPHHLSTAEGALVRTGKVEVRFDGSSLPTRNDKRRTVEWQKVAYNVAHQMAYYKQVYDNVVQRAEEAERKYAGASIRAENMERDRARLKPLINAAFELRTHWAFFLLPKSFRRLVSGG